MGVIGSGWHTARGISAPGRSTRRSEALRRAVSAAASKRRHDREGGGAPAHRMIVGRQVVVAAQHLVAIVHDIATSLAEAAAESSSYAYRRVHAGRRGDPPIEVARPRLPVRNRAQPRDTRKPTIRHHVYVHLCINAVAAQQRAGSPSLELLLSLSPFPPHCATVLRRLTAPRQLRVIARSHVRG
jgi:hypothetical protein